MKQKITLQIDNDTGVEFEEQAEFREPKEGDWILQEQTFNMLIHKTSNDCKYPRIILTPKIDHELEEAKKLIGKWIKCKGDNFAFEVEEVYRDKEDNFIKVYNKTLGTYFVSETDPFPLPVWRCCEADKPKVDGIYFTRRKFDSRIKDIDSYNNGSWTIISKNKREWLDEGEL